MTSTEFPARSTQPPRRGPRRQTSGLGHGRILRDRAVIREIATFFDPEPT